MNGSVSAPRAHVMAVGSAVLDYVYRVDIIPASAEKHFAADHCDIAGGIAVNAALAIQSLGGQAHILARIGSDFAGDCLRKTLEDAAVDLSLLERLPGIQSSSSAVIVDDRGERMIIAHRSKDLFNTPPQLPATLMHGLDAVLGDVRWTDGTEIAFAAARQAGVPTILDLDQSDQAIPDPILSTSDYIVFGEAALKLFTGCLGIEDALRQAEQRCPSSRLAVTTGHNGVHFINCSGQQRHIAARPVQPISPLGAGDVFHGAFALAIGEGHDFETALRFANDVAALKVCIPPDEARFPTRAEVESLGTAHNSPSK